MIPAPTPVLADDKPLYLFIQPSALIQEVTAHARASSLFPTEHGWFPRVDVHEQNRPRGCRDHILILCTAGRGHCRVEYPGRPPVEVTVTPNTSLLLPANVPHSYGTDPQDPWSIHWIHFGGTQAGWWTTPDHVCAEVGFERVPKIRDLFEDINQILSRGSQIDNIILAGAVLGHLLTYLFHPVYLPAHRSDLVIHRLEAVIQFMQNNLDAKISLDELAKIANYSATQFIKVFRRHTGFPPKEYCQYLRIRVACTLLHEGDRPIKEIATELGFSDQLYFSRVFRALIGESPRSYRERPQG
jgi:AraC family transcriptional regulator, arabinose operon regulatory protein